MTTRQILPSDFKEIYQFWQEAGLHLYPEAEEQKRFDDMLHLNPELCFCFVDENDRVFGTILGGFDGRTATINRLAISPAQQNKGLGKLLIAQLEKKLLNRGIKKVAVLIHIDNTQVIPFYEKLGFTEMTYVKSYYKDL